MTLELPAESPVRDLPWIITYGPLNDDEDWEPVVCGPYERVHALALAEEVIADEQLMAVVEPLMAFTGPDQMRAEIALAKATAADDELVFDDEPDGDQEHGFGDGEPGGHPAHGPGPLPDPDEVRAGMARLATRFAGGEPG